jgi:nuclear transcription factor Y alpha
MSWFTVSQPSWQNSTEQSLSKELSLKPQSPPQLYHDAKLLGVQLPGRESSSSQSISQSQQEGGAMGGTDSQKQSISSASDESFGRDAGGQMKPILSLTNPEVVLNPLRVDHSQSVARIPYPYADPYYSGMYAAYGPQTMVQPLMVGIPPVRVPLPLELSEDGPIYVNAKQYHGILRRRQSRAKLEAQNKLVKTRKPYLHESRHIHALKRVRGVGGRFLSKKELQQHASANSISKFYATSDFESHGSGSGNHVTASYNDVMFQQGDNNRLSGFSLHMVRGMQNNGGLMCSGNPHCASVVR